MTADDSTPQMHEDEVLVDDRTVWALLEDQFPNWADEGALEAAAKGSRENDESRAYFDEAVRSPGPPHGPARRLVRQG